MNKREINKIKKACSVTDKIFKTLIKKLKTNSFKTEREIYNFLIKQIKNANCNIAFKPIVATGKNSAEIHHKATDAKLKKGFLVIDFGVKYNGYCSDCTRTFYLGKPSKKEKALYNLVLKAQEIALLHAQPGVYAADIDLIARTALQKYYKNFLHGTGHGVGKKIHQSPGLKPRSRLTLKRNQTVTIEPGLYFKNKFGIRIEDTIVVKEKPAILTKSTKKLVVING